MPDKTSKRRSAKATTFGKWVGNAVYLYVSAVEYASGNLGHPLRFQNRFGCRAVRRCDSHVPDSRWLRGIVKMLDDP